MSVGPPLRLDERHALGRRGFLHAIDSVSIDKVDAYLAHTRITFETLPGDAKNRQSSLRRLLQSRQFMTERFRTC
jgi:hypothetical protein